LVGLVRLREGRGRRAFLLFTKTCHHLRFIPWGRHG
jgi:hypothetical protein